MGCNVKFNWPRLVLLLIDIFNSIILDTFFFYLALVVIDNMRNGKNAQDHDSISSDDSTIDIMSSGDEDIDITNDLDPPETSNKYITEVNNSASELAQEYVILLIL